MKPTDLQFPDDVDALKAMILALAEKAARTEALEAEVADLKARNADADEQIASLKQILKAYDRYRFGRRSEKQGNQADADLDEQGAFVFEEIDTGIAAIQAKVSQGRDPDATKRAPRQRKGFPPHLERVHVVIEPDELPEHVGKQKVLIGEDTSERLDVIPPKFRVIVTHRPKYAFKNEDGVIQAAAAAHIVEGGIPTEALLAYIAVSKYGDGLPLYRQEAIFLRDDVEIDRGLMARWMGKLGFELQILADYIFDRIKEGERIFADETTLPTLVAGLGSAMTAYLWAYAKDDRTFGGIGPAMVAYRFEDNRSGDCVALHLEGYRGILQIDGYAAYNRVARSNGGNDGALLAGCWAHGRRRFYELHASGSSKIATATIEKMAALWAIEDSVRGKSPEHRVSARKASAAIVADLYRLWEETLPRISGKSKLAEAIRYALNRREAFEQFLHDGRIEIDSNIVERAIRPQAIVRKNSLFAGSAGGGRTWATIATLIQTAKMNGVDPLAWLIQTLERIAAGWPASDLETLMPWKFQK